MPRAWPKYIPSSSWSTRLAVKALVEATPISGPACIRMAPPLTRCAMLPKTLTMLTSRAPLRCASSMAASVSTVSPD